MRSSIAVLAASLFFMLGRVEAPAVNRDESNPISAAEVQEWGEETLSTIRADFWLDEEGLSAERIGRRRRWRRPRPAFMWSAGVQLSALAAAARIDKVRHVDSLAAYAASLKTYWHEHNDIGGYDVQPAPAQSDRYYDDNAWIVLALVEVFEVTNDRRYLDDAIKTLGFVVSGEDDALSGGIYWRENALESKNTCSNAPAIVGALRLYQKAERPEDLATARRLYEWTCAHLQDPDDGLFWDNMALSGRVDRRKYSYNSALMIRANCLFHQVTSDPKYLAEAQRIARAAESQWVDPKTGAMRDAGKFAHMLLEALLAVRELDEDPHWLELATNSVAYVHGELRDPNGHYPSRWDRPAGQPLRSAQLIDQASAARAFFVVADAMAEKGSAAGP